MKKNCRDSAVITDVRSVTVDLEVDATGLACPMPLLKLRQGLNGIKSQQTVRLLATDSGSVRDVNSFIELSEHTLLASSECLNTSQTTYIYIIQKA